MAKQIITLYHAVQKLITKDQHALALSKKDTCVLVLEKLKLAAAGVKMSDKFNEQLSSWSDMVSQEYGIAHHTEHGVVHLWNPN